MTTNATVLKLLRQHANNCPSHRGNARKIRESVRRDAETMREAIKNKGWLAIGRGGWTLHISPNSSLHGYDDGEPFRTLCARAGLIVWDSREVEFSRAAHIAIRCPMPGFKADCDGQLFKAGALSFVPAIEIARLWRDAGAWTANVTGAADSGL